MSLTPSLFGSQQNVEGNPFIADDISGKENSVASILQKPTNCLIYKDSPPTIHIYNNRIPKILQLVDKNIQEMPVIPVGVKALFISKNSIKDVKQIAQHPTLEIIDVSFNLIEVAEIDPPPHLKALILSSNNITEILSTCILSNLRVLNISQNKITDFNTDICPNIMTLNLSYNKIKEFSLHSKTMVELSLQNNFIDTFTVEEAPELLRLDLSFNKLEDISFIEKLPKITHFSAEGNKLAKFWESYVVYTRKKIIAINGRVLTEGEKAIHRDRVLRTEKPAEETPYQLISSIRKEYKKIKSLTVEMEECPDDIVCIWMARSHEKCQRLGTVEHQSRSIKNWIHYEKDGALVVYGPMLPNDIPSKPFRSLSLNYTPIHKGGPVEQAVIELAKRQPIILTLNHNMLNTLADLLFLRFFDSVTILSIEGNLAAKMTLFRPFISYIMPSINVINGVELSTLERQSGIDHFQNLLSIACGLVPEQE